MYTGSATCWAICAGVDAGGIGVRAPALSFNFHVFTLRAGLIFFSFSVSLCHRFGRVWSLLMLATSAVEFAGKSDRRCALFFSVAGFWGDDIVPGRFPFPLGAQIF